MGKRGQLWRTGCEAGLGTGEPCVAMHAETGDTDRGSRVMAPQAVDASELPEALVHQWFKA